MNTNPPNPPRRGLAGRPILTTTIAVAAVIGAGLGGVALANRGGPAPTWQSPPASASAPPSAAGQASPEKQASPERQASPEKQAEQRIESTTKGAISLSATGDIVMGGFPGRQPLNGGRDLFTDVKSLLPADLVMGNLEQPLTEDTGVDKCAGSTPGQCFAFRVPPSWAGHLKDAGFQLLNTANNHGKDFGSAGYASTQKALKNAGLQFTGPEDMITVVDVKGVKVAVVGFAPYDGFNDVRDLPHAKQVIKQAAEKADVVVVQVHMGAEGRTMTHVKPGPEMYVGENRGDPVAFSKAVVDAGADLVIGHGPHVLRGMEFYRGRLIAYSLGNFMGAANTLGVAVPNRFGGVLTVSVKPDGSWAGGTFSSTAMNATGVPKPDREERGRKLVAELSATDFPTTGARVADDGSVSPRS